ncbi:type VI secretion system tube protein TssD [Dysgonomonas sp. 25]|uniref:type VI secretion system tube protein TssD n=1 Tax=Dysgonomonas sp. 25 TaxID=2302933 RepID=UPI0013D11757|nr:type VI secretion system tube protein TssD [Dysgonomonas sp. 25]NDV69692.1 type VI secretion system needle protein Hcp [Dysgonomonas sp. 25]
MNLKDGLNKAASLLSFPLTDSNVTVWLQIDGHEYEVEQFKIGFSQPTDYKGEPQAETKGGQLMVTLSEALPDSFYEWAIKPGLYKDGAVNFKIQTGGAPLWMKFFRAACISFGREVSENGGGLSTRLVISPERIMINGVEHDNLWVE